MFHAAIPGSSADDTKRRALNSSTGLSSIMSSGATPTLARSALINAAEPQSPHKATPGLAAGIVVVVTGDFGALFFSL
jgi:hypothetical protein